MIVTIDGPAGAGKSSAARRLAERLGFRFLDTGAMYRAVTWWALHHGWPLDKPQQLAELARQLTLDWRDDRLYVNGEDVTEHLRRPEVTEAIHCVADNTAIRNQLVTLQRRWAEGKDIVTEGRDQGTVAFPDAECKIFLTASTTERARRRHQELKDRGIDADFSDVLRELELRDQRDTQRPVGGLCQAEDAVVVVTDGMSLDEVVNHLEHLVRTCAQRARRPRTVN
jgi:cytidylate kinase/pantoate ligase/cytidylate kinase